jgi:hypothetical protein
MSYVQIKNRNDCCPETLNGARVEVMTAAGTWVTCGSDVSGATLGGVYRRECTSLLTADETVLQIKISNPGGGGKIVPLAEVTSDAKDAIVVDSRDPFSEFPRGKQLSFVDMDNDGDLDVVVEQHVGEMSDGLKDYWENIGSPNSPAFAERASSTSLLSGVLFERMGSCTFADLNGDTHEEMYCGGTNGDKNNAENGKYSPYLGAPTIFKMATPELVGGEFSLAKWTENPFLNDTSGEYLYSTPINGMETTLEEYMRSSMVTFFDMDDDGDLDMLCGHGFRVVKKVSQNDMDKHFGNDNYQYFENEGSVTSPQFTPRSKAESPFHTLPSRVDDFGSHNGLMCSQAATVSAASTKVTLAHSAVLTSGLRIVDVEKGTIPLGATLTSFTESEELTMSVSPSGVDTHNLDSRKSYLTAGNDDYTIYLGSYLLSDNNNVAALSSDSPKCTPGVDCACPDCHYIKIGAVVMGVGIPVGTKVVALTPGDGSSVLTLSRPATVSGNPTLTFALATLHGLDGSEYGGGNGVLVD